MTPVYLRFPDQAAAIAAFNTIAGEDAAALSDVPPVVFLAAGPIYIDVVFGTGIVSRPTGETVTNVEGNVVDVAAPIPGFHVNLLLPDGVDLPEALAAVRINPAAPACTWAVK